METETIQMCYVARGLYYCPNCGAIYFRETKCHCPNKEFEYLLETQKS